MIRLLVSDSDFAPSPEGLPQPSQNLLKSTKITTNTETAMLSTLGSLDIVDALIESTVQWVDGCNVLGGDYLDGLR